MTNLATQSAPTATAGAGPKFVMREVDDECFEVECNGQFIGSYNHDSHGWDGMRAVRNAVTAIAQATGGTLTELDIGEEAES